MEWRFISLRLINADVDYHARFPEGYDAGHTAGLRLLRVAAAVRADHGPDAVGAFYERLGARVFDSNPNLDTPDPDHRGTPDFLEPALTAANLNLSYAPALEDPSGRRDPRGGRGGAGTYRQGHPHANSSFRAAAGVAFFGPVISRLPREENAAALWDHVVGLARFPGFAQMKRSLREQPQLRSFGVRDDEAGLQEDWHSGSRRTHK